MTEDIVDIVERQRLTFCVQHILSQRGRQCSVVQPAEIAHDPPTPKLLCGTLWCWADCRAMVSLSV